MEIPPSPNQTNPPTPYNPLQRPRLQTEWPQAVQVHAVSRISRDGHVALHAFLPHDGRRDMLRVIQLCPVLVLLDVERADAVDASMQDERQDRGCDKREAVGGGVSSSTHSPLPACTAYSHQEDGESPHGLHRGAGSLDPSDPLQIVSQLPLDVVSRGAQGVQAVDGLQPLHAGDAEKLVLRVGDHLVGAVHRVRADDGVHDVPERPDVFVQPADGAAVEPRQRAPDEHGGDHQDDGGGDVGDRDGDVRQRATEVPQEGDEGVDGQDHRLRRQRGRSARHEHHHHHGHHEHTTTMTSTTGMGWLAPPRRLTSAARTMQSPITGMKQRNCRTRRTVNEYPKRPDRIAMSQVRMRV